MAQGAANPGIAQQMFRQGGMTKASMGPGVGADQAALHRQMGRNPAQRDYIIPNSNLQLARGMGGMTTDRVSGTSPPGNQATRQAGYQASMPNAMDRLWRQNPVVPPTPQWMGRR